MEKVVASDCVDENKTKTSQSHKNLLPSPQTSDGFSLLPGHSSNHVTRSKSFNDSTNCQRKICSSCLRVHSDTIRNINSHFSKQRRYPSSDSNTFNLDVNQFCDCTNYHSNINQSELFRNNKISSTSNSSSGHILGRIFRRMHKISFAWRRSKLRKYHRGDLF